jgi:hypothetical protein
VIEFLWENSLYITIGFLLVLTIALAITMPPEE